MTFTQEKKILSPAGIATILFVLIIAWWFILFLTNTFESGRFIWAASYQVVAMWGVIWGFVALKKWGGFRSLMGKAVGFFTIGLLLQVFGQSSFSFFNIVLDIYTPYPSIPDIGYFGSIPFFILGGIYLGKASGAQFSIHHLYNKAQVFGIPIAMVLLSYFLFLQNYPFSEIGSLQIFFDFAYPIGQALFVSVAIVVYSLSKKYLGGIMKRKVLLILLALVMQYISDYNFLFQNINETWINGGYGDVLYLITYFLMTLGLISLMDISDKQSYDLYQNKQKTKIDEPNNLVS